MAWLIPSTDLTPEQQRAIELTPSENRAILGGPGSGKTQILLHRARHLCDTFGVGDEKFRIFVYTSILKNYIKSALNELNLPDDNVLTFDHWCRLFHQAHIREPLPLVERTDELDLGAIRKVVMQRALGPKLQRPFFDFLLVDEGQDFEEEVFAFLAKISRHVTVCLDKKQQVYDVRSTEDGILRALGIPKRNISLIDAFRVCPYIVELAAHLIPNAREREDFRNQTRQPQIEKQTPLLYFACDDADELRKLSEIVLERQLKNDRIAILLPQRNQIVPLAKSLAKIELEVEVPERMGSPTHDFTSLRPKLMNYHSAKGLSFDSVLMPRLVSGCFGGYFRSNTPDQIERLLFVAVTRASKWCYFSTERAKQLPLLKRKLMPLARSGLLSVVECRRSYPPPPPAPAPPQNNDLGFL